MMMQAAVMPVVGDLIVKPTLNRTWVQLLARLEPGVTPERASSVLEPIYRQNIPQVPPALRRESVQSTFSERRCATPDRATRNGCEASGLLQRDNATAHLPRRQAKVESG